MRISDWSSDVCSSDLPDLPEIIKGRLLPLADIVTPNPFEFAILVGAKLSGFAQFSGEAERWLRHGMRHVLVTGCLLDDTPLGQLDTLLDRKSTRLNSSH